MTEIDTTTAPRGILAAQRLVAAAVDKRKGRCDVSGFPVPSLSL